MELLKLFYEALLLFIDALSSIVERIFVWFATPENFEVLIEIFGTTIGSVFAVLSDPYIIPHWLQTALLANFSAFTFRYVTGAWIYIKSNIPFVN